MSNWNSDQYLKFEQERTQPSIDLIARIGLPAPLKILDVGCGPGNSTAALKRRFSESYVLGIDSSSEMIRAAKAHYCEMDFVLCDAANELTGLDHDFDLVFSNACIQWVPNHEKLLSDMASLLRPGGMLAVQTPMNYKEPIHIIIEQLVSSARWKEKIPDKRIFHNLLPEQYYDLLSSFFREFSIWETTYYHSLHSHDGIIEWYKGSGLRPYINALSEADGARFIIQVKEALLQAYPKQTNGDIIFRFPRFFFTAQK